MREIADEVERWLQAGQDVAVATVVAVRGSGPRPPGTKMAVSSAGAIAGAVSGGCVEGAVVLAAEDVLAGGAPRLLHIGIADEDAWEVGLPCGGELDVWVDRYAHAELVRATSREERVALVTRLDDNAAKLLLRGDGTVTGSLGEPPVDAAALRHARDLLGAERSERRTADGVEVFVDVACPSPRLIIFGAIDHAAALCRLARGIGWRTYIVDPRTRFATRERFPDATAVVAAWPDRALAQLGGVDASTAVVVLTHDPKLDDAALGAVLRSDAGYIGAMGSRRMQARRRERLLEAGLTEAEMERLSAPVGLDIGGVTPDETALSILAEIVAVRRGRSGGRLGATTGRIHEVCA